MYFRFLAAIVCFFDCKYSHFALKGFSWLYL
nr:MAG TPA: hypothetical protein [Caudoviricetes sp.]